jgi:hypothetical protein
MQFLHTLEQPLMQPWSNSHHGEGIHEVQDQETNTAQNATFYSVLLVAALQIGHCHAEESILCTRCFRHTASHQTGRQEHPADHSTFRKELMAYPAKQPSGLPNPCTWAHMHPYAPCNVPKAL